MAKKRLFGTFGVRRTANDVLTPEFASRLAASYGSIVQGTVAIGGDTRTSTPMLKHAITAGLLHELRTQDGQTGFRKGRGTRDQIASICWDSCLRGFALTVPLVSNAFPHNIHMTQSLTSHIT